jgi:hypothetical protein
MGIKGFDYLKLAIFEYVYIQDVDLENNHCSTSYPRKAAKSPKQIRSPRQEFKNRTARD